MDSLHLDSAYVIGWSDGGIDGLLLAIRHPNKVKKLAVSGTNLTPDTLVNTDTASEVKFAKRIAAMTHNDPQLEKTKKVVHLMDVEPHISLSQIHRITSPVLVIGGHDNVIEPSRTVQILENIPQAYLWMLPKADHGTIIHYKMSSIRKCTSSLRNLMNLLAGMIGKINYLVEQLEKNS